MGDEGRDGGRCRFGRKEKRGEGEEDVGEGENLERKGRREKEEILRVLRGEDGNKGVGGRGVDAYPMSTLSCMLKCVPCACLFMRMLTLFKVVKC